MKRISTTYAMHVQDDIVARSRYHSCFRNETIRSPFIVVGVDVGTNNIEAFSVAMEMREQVSCALLNYKMFRTIVNTSVSQTLNIFFKYYLLRRSGTKLYHFST